MSESLKIDISGINSDFISTLQNRYSKDVKINHDAKNHSIRIEFSKPIHEKFILNTLDSFLNNTQDKNNKELMPYWFFDENNSLVRGPTKNFLLTKREVKFLKLLLNSRNIVTYSKMIQVLWDNPNTVSKNAMRLFTKNIKKKLPPNILMNFHNIGYKLAS